MRTKKKSLKTNKKEVSNFKQWIEPADWVADDYDRIINNQLGSYLTQKQAENIDPLNSVFSEIQESAIKIWQSHTARDAQTAKIMVGVCKTMTSENGHIFIIVNDIVGALGKEYGNILYHMVGKESKSYLKEVFGINGG